MRHNPIAFENFARVYKSELPKAIAKYPQEYAFSIEDAQQVADRMLVKIASNGIGSVNVADSRGMAAACKILGIRHTYKAIREFLGEEAK